MKAFAGAAGGAVATVIPLLLIIAGNTPPDDPAPAEVQLDVDLTDAAWPATSNRHHILVLAPTVFEGAARASDSRGLNRAVVTPVSRANCDDVEARDLRLDGDLVENCLELRNLNAGSPSTAVLRSTNGTRPVALTLVLQTRHALVWPLLAASVGLAASFFLAVFRRIRPMWSTTAKLSTLGRGVEGGARWVEESALRLDRDAQVAILEKVRSHGPPLDEAQRQRLAQVLAQTTDVVGERHHLSVDSQQELETAGSKDTPNVRDFFDLDGKPVTHPLAVTAGRLDDLREAVERATDLLHLVEGEVAIADRDDLLVKLQRVRDQLQGASDWASVGRFRAALDAIELEILKAGMARGADGARAGAGLAAAPLSTRRAPAATQLDTVDVERLAGATTIVVAAIAAVVALAGVLSGTWGADADFGTALDYFAVVVAAFGAGSAGSITALVADRVV